MITFAPRESKEAVEEGLKFAPKFDEHGLIAAMAVDAETNAPLMLAYMNEESLRITLELGQAVYWSRSRKTLWHKGATSGEFQEIVEIRTDCDPKRWKQGMTVRTWVCCSMISLSQTR